MKASAVSGAVGLFVASIALGCAGLGVDEPSAVHQSADRLPYRLRARAVHTYFGNALVLTDVEGDSREYRPGATYLVKGRYTLQSEHEAVLMLWCVGGWVQELDTVDPEPQHGGSLRLKRGEGEFSFRFKVKEVGDLHLSIYPVGGGDSFASLYFTISIP